MSSNAHSTVGHSGTMRSPIGMLIPITRPVEVVALDGRLEQLQDLVGGMIEAIPIPTFIDHKHRSTAYVNEEGKFLGLEPNMRATDFLVQGVGLHFGDHIAGPLLLAGFDPESGDHADLPECVAARIRLIEREAGVS
jgi:Domain of unknown function (DUF3846)